MSAQDAARDDIAATVRARLADLIEDDHPDDIRFARRLLDSFVDRSPGMLDGVAAAVAAADAVAATHLAHALRGAAGNVGATGMAQLCGEVERCSEAARFDLAAARLPDLTAQLAAVRGQLTTVSSSLARLIP